MTDFHRNIFYYYRGGRRSDADRERQLEDNTTKALINTLEYGSPAVVASFLKWLGITPSEGKTNFELQRRSIGRERIRSRPQRVLLGLVPKEAGTESGQEASQSVEEGSRPDAWMYGDNYVVLIESKVVGGLDADQKRRHELTLAAGAARTVRQEERRWPDVHRFFLDAKAELRLSGKNKWLVEQFTQYLEWNGMSDFAGLEEGVFEYFVTRDDPDTRTWVRGTVTALAEAVGKKLEKRHPFYSAFGVGRLSQGHCWAAFGPSGGAYRQWAHQTLALHESGVDVFVNVELKAATDRLKKRIREQREAFQQIVLGCLLDVPFCIQVDERKQRQVQQYDYHRVATLEADYLKDPRVGARGFGYLATVLEEIRLPCVMVKTSIGRDDALKLSKRDHGCSLVARVVSIMRAFHPLVEFINGPDVASRS